MTLNLYQVDAFAEKVFSGNPAAVVPLNAWIDDALMQQIAMENNLSETAFFVPVAGNGEARYHLRWFTPEYEIDLCGHATLASAYVIHKFLQPHINHIIFSTEKAGELRVSISEGLLTLDFPSRMPQPCPLPPALLPSLGLKEAKEVLRSRDYFVVLNNEDEIKNLKPDFEKMKELVTIGVIVTARGQSAEVVSRCFYPGAGIAEDPVTGSAHCNIVPYWCTQLGKTNLHCRQLSLRGGELHCELKGDRVLMSGKCVLFMEGKIFV